MSVHDETFDYDKTLAVAKDKKSTQELKTLTKRFFEILDTKDISDSGKEFSPVKISCCRTFLTEELNRILSRMKELSND